LLLATRFWSENLAQRHKEGRRRKEKEMTGMQSGDEGDADEDEEIGDCGDRWTETVGTEK
jgi:hypothetical protein